jgi:hypothetical protein
VVSGERTQRAERHRPPKGGKPNDYGGCGADRGNRGTHRELSGRKVQGSMAGGDFCALIIKICMGVNAQEFGPFPAGPICGSRCILCGCGFWTMAAQGELLARSQIDNGVGGN